LKEIVSNLVVAVNNNLLVKDATVIFQGHPRGKWSQRYAAAGKDF
jgi:hypothetical protein